MHSRQGLPVARSPSAGTLALIGAALLAACGGERPGEPPGFALELIAPAEGELHLDQVLSLHFSAPVSPTSLTRSSLSIEAEEGTPARGLLRVDGSVVYFLPDPPLRADLSDAGFRPGTRYTLFARGFPHLDGLRSVDGRPLRRSFRREFATVPASDAPRELFLDPAPGGAEGLLPVGSVPVGDEIWLRLRAGEPIELEHPGGQIFPPSVRSEDFVLERLGRDEGEREPLDARLVENHDSSAALPRGTARIELRPLRELAPGSYVLSLPPFGFPPVDLAGNSLRRPTQSIRVEVYAPGEEFGVHEERFLDAERQSSLAVDGADGTAAWNGDGVVTVTYPAAAGDGSAGRVDLSLLGPGASSDVQAVGIALARGATVELAETGLVCLRAQRSIELAGRVVRRGGPARGLSWRPGERLSDWLARARQEDAPWTVLIAGGDLVVSGALATDGPLLLVAGGAVRVTGAVTAQPSQTWLLGRGGGLGLDPTRSSPELVIDPPGVNPLVEPLSCAVLSEPLPASGGLLRWVSARAYGRDRMGRWRVRYAPAEPGPAGTWSRRAVDAPWLLEPPGRIRLLVELEVPAAGAHPGLWQPPIVDAVDLHWERTEGN